MVDIVVLALSVLVSAATGLFVLARNPRHIVNRLYGLLSVSLLFFAVGNYLSLKTLQRLFYIRVVIAFSTLIVTCLYYLVLYLGKVRLNRLQRFGIWLSVGVALLDATPLVFSGLRGTVNPVPIPSFGAPLFAIHLVVFLAASFVLLIRRAHQSRGVQRLQYVYMLVGILPMFVLAPITGVVMPVLLKNASLIVLSPVYTAFFVCLVGYAIVRHRLFDVRFIIARLLAYVATIGALSVAYGLLFLGLARGVFHLHVPLSAEIFLSVATGVAALSFHGLKRVFDKISNRLFYQDAYDPQEFFDAFNAVAVSMVDLDGLLRQTAEVTVHYMKAQFCVIVVRHGTADEKRAIGVGTVPTQLKEAELERLYNVAHRHGEKVIVSDDLEPVDDGLRRQLVRDNVAAIVRLTAESGGAGTLGYMILGFKKSGNIYAPQDIKLLTTASSELVIAIQNALRFEEIENFNETLRQKIDEATRKLQRTNQKLRTLDETKDDFISMASHQLRTPLTSVKGYVSMVLDGDAGTITPLQRRLLNQSFISSQRMVYLISDLLNVSRLRTGKFVVEPIETNLAAVVKDEVDQLVETAKGRNVELIYHKPEHFPTLMLDETKMRQVIMNFLDNAIYYTPSGGRIEVRLEDKGNSLDFTVADNGIGVPRSEQHHLFTKFFRADNAKRARPDGTGLGLFMAKKVIVTLGGAIIFKSKEGEGSTFGFTFAKNKVAAASKPSGGVARTDTGPSATTQP